MVQLYSCIIRCSLLDDVLLLSKEFYTGWWNFHLFIWLSWQQQQGRSRRFSSGAILRKNRVQFSNNLEYYSRHSNVSTSRPGHLRILGLDKHSRTSNKFANTLLNFSSCSFSCSSSRDPRVQHHNSIIYAGVYCTDLMWFRALHVRRQEKFPKIPSVGKLELPICLNFDKQKSFTFHLESATVWDAAWIWKHHQLHCKNKLVEWP